MERNQELQVLLDQRAESRRSAPTTYSRVDQDRDTRITQLQKLSQRDLLKQASELVCEAGNQLIADWNSANPNTPYHQDRETREQVKQLWQLSEDILAVARR